MANYPTQFPFLQLSEHVSQRILKSMSVIELFDLSLTSARVRKQVKQRLSNNFSVTISWRVNPQLLVNHPNDPHHAVGFWKFYNSRSFTRRLLINPTTRLINGRKVEFCKARTGLACPTADTPADEILNVFSYLVDLFNGEVSLFEFAVAEVEELLSKVTGGFEKFWTFKKCKELTVLNGRVSHEEMKSILDLESVVEKLELSANPDRGFVLDNQKPISFESLKVHKDNWITRDVLFRLNCQTVELSNTALTNEDINAFLHNWMNSTDTRLQCLCIRANSYDGYGNFIREGEEEKPFTLEKVVCGLETISGSPKPQILAQLMHWGEEPRCENGVDLKRDDQVVATALVETCEYEEDGGTSCLFVVW